MPATKKSPERKEPKKPSPEYVEGILELWNRMGLNDPTTLALTLMRNDRRYQEALRNYNLSRGKISPYGEMDLMMLAPPSLKHEGQTKFLYDEDRGWVQNRVPTIEDFMRILPTPLMMPPTKEERRKPKST